MRALRPLLLGLAILSGLAFLGWRELTLSAAPAQISFLPAGGGTAALIRTNAGEFVLIGGGKKTDIFENTGKLIPFFRRKIALLVLTDYRTINAAVLRQMLTRFTVERAVIGASAAKDAQLLTSILTEAKIPILQGASGDRIDLGGGISLSLLATGKRTLPDVILRSASVTVSFPGRLILPDEIKSSSLKATIESGSGTVFVLEDAKATKAVPDVHNLAKEGVFTTSLETKERRLPSS
jgi:beta-lactamase superfamily II metal-dependent hydrolase